MGDTGFHLGPNGIPENGPHHDHGPLWSASSQPRDTAFPPSFDVVEWYPSYHSCQKYFLEHAQHDSGTQCLMTFLNVRLPFQRHNTSPNASTTPPGLGHASTMFSPVADPSHRHQQALPPATYVSLLPYIRRLVVTGFDKVPVLHGLFGDDWQKGVGVLHEMERRNYLFAAKSVGWAEVKKHYDLGSDETVPFLKPLKEVELCEIQSGETGWSEWLAMQDWMIGPRAPRME